MNNIFRYILFCSAGVVFLLACKDNGARTERYVKARVKNTVNKNAADSCLKMLKAGDLVVRRGDDLTSSMLASLNKHDKRYSHCGIVVVDEDGLFVIHSIGGDDNPDQEIKKESFHQWTSVDNNLRFAVYRYELHDSLLQGFVKKVTGYYNEHKKFDMDFDLQTNDRLYCTEMVYKAMCSITNDSLIKLEYGYDRWFVGVDNLYQNEQAKLICEVEYK